MTTKEPQTTTAKYKRTDIGTLPSDWELKRLSDFGSFSKGKGIRKDEVVPEGIPCVRYGEIYTHHNDFIREFNSHISPEVAKQSRKLKKGDLLFAGSGETAEEIGKCVAFLHDEEAYAGGDVVIFSPGGQDSVFLGYLMNHPIVATQKAKMGQGDAVVHIGARHLAKVLVPLPRKEEQTAIATAMLDTDTAIERLEKLIVKKRAIKQGAMQGLLSGRRRLPGFKGRVGRKAMGEIGRPYGGLAGKTKRDFGEGNATYIPFLNVINNPIIDTRSLERVNVYPGEKQNRAKKGDLFFNGSSETPDEVGMCSLLDDDIQDLYLNSFCFGFRLSSDQPADGRYLSYFFRSAAGRQAIYSLGQGAIRYNLSKANFLKLGIPFPSVDEQRAIAAVISDMESEISVLLLGLNKWRHLRDGMRQALLTGSIRLES